MKNKILLYFSIVVSFFTLVNLHAAPVNELKFNGTNQYMTIPSHADFNIDETESYTVGIWVKANTYVSGQRFLSKRNLDNNTSGATRAAYEMWSGNSPAQCYAVNTPKSTSGNILSAYSNVAVQAGTWYHIAMVVDRNAGKITMYQNGSVTNESTVSISDWVVNNPYDVYVGAGFGNDGVAKNFMNGSVANLRIYKRALSKEEIKTDREQNDFTALPNELKEAAVGAYDFAETNISEETVTDLSGKNHNATLVNFVQTAGGEEAVYCEPTNNYTSTANRYFTKFSTEGFDADLTDQVIRTTKPTKMYEHLTAVTLKAKPGDEVKIDFSHLIQWDDIILYGDLNGDKDFKDEGEILGRKLGENSVTQTPASFKFSIPTDAKPGLTRLRVKTGWIRGYINGTETETNSLERQKLVYNDACVFNMDAGDVNAKGLGHMVDIDLEILAPKLDTVATPTFTPAAGSYTEVQHVTISTTTEGAKIYYTTDGTAPTTSSIEYTQAIDVAKTQTIKAIAIKEGMIESNVDSAEYVINLVVTEYCEPDDAYDIHGGERVFRKVTTSGFVTNGTFDILAGPNLPTKRYINKTADIKLVANRGSEVTLSFDQSIGWSEVVVYVDYNGNKMFTDDGEIVASSAIDPETKKPANTFTFTIPQAAKLGETRIRVKNDYLRKAENPASGVADWNELDMTSPNWNPCTMDTKEVHHMADFLLEITAQELGTNLINLEKENAITALFKDGNLIVCGIEGRSLITLYSLAGKKLISEVATNKIHTISTDLSRGVYILKVGTKTMKLIK